MKKTVAVIGTGMIGGSWTALFAGNGYRVKLFARSEASAQKGLDHVAGIFDMIVQKGFATKEQAEKCKANISIVSTYPEMADCEAIFESVYENIEIKRDVYNRIAEECPECKAIASATSTFLPNDLVDRNLEVSRKVVVAHPINPPFLTRFIEIACSSVTEDEPAELIKSIFEDCGKYCCFLKTPGPGFIYNRIQHAIIRESFYMIEQGYATAEEIDTAIKMVMGPRHTQIGLLEHQDRCGYDLVKNCEDYLYPALCDAKQASDLMNRLVETKQRGAKDGKGLFVWGDGAIEDFDRRAAEPFWSEFNWKIPE